MFTDENFMRSWFYDMPYIYINAYPKSFILLGLAMEAVRVGFFV